jgi:hypothetical protein
VAKPPDAGEKLVHTVADVQGLQSFAITIRDLQGRAIKLNAVIRLLGMIEVNTFNKMSEESVRTQLEIDPAIINYTASVLCKIQAFQTVRSFAANVQSDYTAMVGAIMASMLPIAYAWLGAYANRLRLFSETIRKRTYHPSFADSARMITAVIAGSIVGLFNPMQNVATLSPLATVLPVPRHTDQGLRSARAGRT